MSLKRVLLATLVLAACAREKAVDTPARPANRPSILLVTLDTTRADAIGPDAKGIVTPSFNAIAARGTRFTQAYAPVPQTLPSHASMLTGLYPAGHGVRENARPLGSAHPMVQERLKSAGYQTAAFVSAFALAKRFGLARGFDAYDEDFGEELAERGAPATTDRALAWLEKASAGPLFLWVHYYDPHYPYTPPKPFADRHEDNPYLGEVALMDEQLGRLVTAFEKRAGPDAGIIVVADHGEGLGEHGEQQHGNLVYQSTMLVPFVVAGPGFPAAVSSAPVSIRRICDTILGWAGLEAKNSLHGAAEKVIVGEGMKPYLDYGWQPQVMAVEGRLKAIMAGRLEVYDLAADPAETRDLAATADLSRDLRAVLREYPIPTLQSAAQAEASPLDEEARKKLASLGYVAADAPPAVRKDAPRPADMAPLFPTIDKASGLFVREQYAEAIPLLEEILRRDPQNLDAALRLGTSHSSLGHEAAALAAYRKAEAIAPQSPDVRVYLALHLSRTAEWEKAVPELEAIVAQWPDRVPALEGLALLRQRQGRIEDALALRYRIYALRAPSGAELVQTGILAMQIGRTDEAIAALERARSLLGKSFRNDLELGVLYLAARRLAEAREALDRVPPSHPDYPMALFKRAQVSVLLGEPDKGARIDAARRHADAETRELIARERLFN